MSGPDDTSPKRPPLSPEERRRLLARINAARRQKALQANAEETARPAPEAAEAKPAPAEARSPDPAPAPEPAPTPEPEASEPEASGQERPTEPSVPDTPAPEPDVEAPEPEPEVPPAEAPPPDPEPAPEPPAPETRAEASASGAERAPRPAPLRRQRRVDPAAPRRLAPSEPPPPADPPPAREAPLLLEPAPTPEPAPAPAYDPTASWEALPRFEVKEPALVRNLVITARREEPAHAAFDILRARVVKALQENGWHRIGVTSPGPGVGKSFTSINLAITLSRYDNARTMLIEADLRRPGLARYLGLTPEASTGDFLRGETPAEAFLRRPGPNRLNIGRNLAVGLNRKVEPFASELFQQPKTADILAGMEATYRPDVLLYDLPPALAQDDVIALAPHFDCVLLVIGGDRTDAAEVRETERRLGKDMPIIGIVLNKGETAHTQHYGY
ncbi:CpsD/CapB family tyrosine-protein kinase [Pseudoroseicyclus sp. CXY001]|uniref:CpsD/CapB family tyrosine-protein kinase n=1 Tax=Pseudoroseicyclus sp. CXY001 TaxID=3242492 RepID=UPI0035713A29